MPWVSNGIGLFSLCFCVSLIQSIILCYICWGNLLFFPLCMCLSYVDANFHVCVCLHRMNSAQKIKSSYVDWAERSVSSPKNNKKSSLWVFTHLQGSLYEDVPISFAEEWNISPSRKSTHKIEYFYPPNSFRPWKKIGCYNVIPKISIKIFLTVFQCPHVYIFRGWGQKIFQITFLKIFQQTTLSSLKWQVSLPRNKEHF